MRGVQELTGGSFPLSTDTFPTSIRYTAVPYLHHGPIKYSVHHRVPFYRSTASVDLTRIVKIKQCLRSIFSWILLYICTEVWSTEALFYFISKPPGSGNLGLPALYFTRIFRPRVTWGIIDKKIKSDLILLL